MIENVIALLAAHIAAGCLFVSALMSIAHRVPEAFLRFCAGVSMFGSGVAALVLSETRPPWLLVFLSSAAWYAWVRSNKASSRWLGSAVVVVSVASIVWFGWQFREPSWLVVAGSLTSALLLGAVCVTMILGHWYLVDVHLAIAPLKQGAWWLWAGVIGRVLVVSAVLTAGGWEALRISRAADIIFSTAGLFFLFRSFVGLGAPLLLAGLIWQTVKIRSTQSATGLLYVALMLVLFGELISHFLLLTTGLPL